MLNKNDRLWTVADVQKVIPLGETRVREIIRSLPHITLGGKLMIHPSHIERWLQDNTQYPARKAAAKAPVKPTLRAMDPIAEILPYRNSRRKTG